MTLEPRAGQHISETVWMLLFVEVDGKRLRPSVLRPTIALRKGGFFML